MTQEIAANFTVDPKETDPGKLLAQFELYLRELLDLPQSTDNQFDIHDVRIIGVVDTTELQTALTQARGAVGDNALPAWRRVGELLERLLPKLDPVTQEAAGRLAVMMPTLPPHLREQVARQVADAVRRLEKKQEGEQG